ncbi:hypothetical protein BJ742DRAFT_741837 [Cladochytrium replicatum]|nr:hypothetical protein BJ742DRAFT_741837 [Cladochytrium replicatum]
MKWGIVSGREQFGTVLVKRIVKEGHSTGKLQCGIVAEDGLKRGYLCLNWARIGSNRSRSTGVLWDNSRQQADYEWFYAAQRMNTMEQSEDSCEETDWAEWYQPHKDIDSEVLRGLTDQPSAEELRAAYVSLASGKAPGKIVVSLGPRAFGIIHKLTCLEFRAGQETYTTLGIIHQIPKTPEEWNGDIWVPAQSH